MVPCLCTISLTHLLLLKLVLFPQCFLSCFSQVQMWVAELKRHAGKNIMIAIAGNKYDLEKSRNVNEEDVLQ